MRRASWISTYGLFGLGMQGEAALTHPQYTGPLALVEDNGRNRNRLG